MKRKRIYLIACGGTIAGIGTDACDLTQYKAGQTTWQEMVQAVPFVREIAELEGEQYCNIDSSDMTEAHWLGLAARVQAIVDDPIYDGVVLTHGTDTLEETAYALNLLVHTEKPVVITGAMRPATALSADGPLNFLAAVQTVCDAAAGSYGVLVLLNNRLCAARFVEKMDTMQVDAFQSRQQGYVGIVQDGKPEFYQRPVKRCTQQSQLYLPVTNTLPYVPIVYCHVGMRGNIFPFFANDNAKAIILVGMGHGRVSEVIKNEVMALQQRKILCVRTSRTFGGMVTKVDEYATWLWANSLSPQKAKIVVQLALAQGYSAAQIQDILNTH